MEDNLDEDAGPSFVGKHHKVDPLEDDEEEFRFRVFISPGDNAVRLCAVSHPQRKKEMFAKKADPSCRFKQNVGLLEVRVDMDKQSGCYDRNKCVQEEAMPSSKSKKLKKIPEEASSQEVYEGRIFTPSAPFNYAVCKIKDGKCYLTPVDGLVSLSRSLAHMDAKKAVDKDFVEDESANESDAEAQPVRVKFSRPETARQKKRREASAFHREKQIASDVWVPLKVQNASEQALPDRMKEFLNSPNVSSIESKDFMKTMDLERFHEIVSETILRK